MESNKNEPLSLRAIGAFTVEGVKVYEEKCELVNRNSYDLEKCVDRYLKHFYNTIQTANVNTFINNINSSLYHDELRESLIYVHNQQYREAINCLKDSDEGIFQNGEIDINTAILEYCKEKINKS